MTYLAAQMRMKRTPFPATLLSDDSVVSIDCRPRDGGLSPAARDRRDRSGGRSVASPVVRTLKIVVALLLALAGPAACGLLGSGPSEDEQIQKILDENASFSVFLSTDATTAQRTTIEAALKALPGATTVTYYDHDAAYERMEQLFSAEPSRMPQIEPKYLPESFEVAMTDIAAVRNARKDEITLKSLQGVQEVVFPCTTVRECREKHSPKPTAPPS